MFTAFSPDDLRRLGSLIKAGTVVAPVTDGVLRREHLPPALREAVASLDDAAFTPTQLAAILTLLAQERERTAHDQPRIELVATGPNSQVNARDTAVVVEQLFHEARNEILIVGFAVHDGATVFKTIAERLSNEPRLRVMVCLDVPRRSGESDSEATIVDRFRRAFKKHHWTGTSLPELYYDPRSLGVDRETRAVLHAKTIVIDGASALVTSANPTPAAYQRNIELGVVIRGGPIPASIRDHFLALIAAQDLLRIS